MGQKASILVPRAQPIKKPDQRRQEQDKVINDSEITIQKVHLEVQKELKQLSDANLKRQQEHHEVINNLQEQAKESSSLVKGLRSDLEDARQKMLMFDNRVHELENQILEEQKASSASRKRAEELEAEIRRVRKQLETEIDLQRVKKELDDEKAAREEAWAKISALQQEMNDTMRELDFERRRLKLASDKIALVETHLRDFHSTTEEMKELFGKQHDELKEMQVRLVEVEEEISDQKTNDPVNQTPGNDDSEETETTAIGKLRDRVEASSGDVTEKAEQAPMLVLQMTGISN